MTGLQLADRIDEDLKIIRSVIGLLEGAVSGADECVDSSTIPLLMDTGWRINRVIENSDKMWQMLRAKLQAEKSENDTE